MQCYLNETNYDYVDINCIIGLNFSNYGESIQLLTTNFDDSFYQTISVNLYCKLLFV